MTINTLPWMTGVEFDYLIALHHSLRVRMQRPGWTMLDTLRWAIGQAGKQANLGSYPWPTAAVEEPLAEDDATVEEYAFEPPPTEEVTEQDLLTYTVAELRDMASDMGVDLTGLGRKVDIVDALRRAMTE